MAVYHFKFTESVSAVVSQEYKTQQQQCGIDSEDNSMRGLEPFVSIHTICRVESLLSENSMLGSHNFPGKLPLKFSATSNLK